jgi:nitrite reductase/ring-hydroxylating ferredoxin subunit
MPEYRLLGATKLKDGEKRILSAGKKKILVLRRESALLSFQRSCPHARAPLEEGAICNGRLVCPWYMGTFRLPDGKLVKPPPMDGLKSYPVRETDREAFVTLPTRHSPSKNEATSLERRDQRTFLIVGAGAAGSMAAKTLRDDGFKGKLIGKLIVVDPVIRTPFDVAPHTVSVLKGPRIGISCQWTGRQR